MLNGNQWLPPQSSQTNDRRATDVLMVCWDDWLPMYPPPVQTCGFKQRQTGRLQSADWHDRLRHVWRASHPGGVIGIITPNLPDALKTVLSKAIIDCWFQMLSKLFQIHPRTPTFQNIFLEVIPPDPFSSTLVHPAFQISGSAPDIPCV